MSKILVYFECQTEHLGTIMSTMGPAMNLMEHFRVETANEPQNGRKKRVTKKNDDKPSDFSISNPAWRNYKNSVIQRLIVSSLRVSQGHTLSYNELRAVLVKEGYSKNSLNAAMTYLKKAEYIKTDGVNATLISEPKEG